MNSNIAEGELDRGTSEAAWAGSSERDLQSKTLRKVAAKKSSLACDICTVDFETLIAPLLSRRGETVIWKNVTARAVHELVHDGSDITRFDTYAPA